MLRFISHFTYSILADDSTRSICSKIPSTTSGREKSSTYWWRPCFRFRFGVPTTQSGWACINREASFTISGSNHKPNFMPSLLISPAKYFSPLGSLSLFTNQSPSEVVSSLRVPNQPSSRTSSSMPRSAAALAMASIFSSLKSK
ncbi:hypothetical protein D1872_266070 [compost metagenome]